MISFLYSGLQPKTRLLYRREFQRFERAIGGPDVWASARADSRDYLVSQYLVRGFGEGAGTDDAVSRTQAGYLIHQPPTLWREEFALSGGPEHLHVPHGLLHKRLLKRWRER